MPVRQVWVDAGNDADYTKLKTLGITAPFFDARDPRVTKTYLLGVKVKGFQPGIYVAWNWYPGLSGAQFADKVSELLTGCGSDTPPHFPKVCANIETHDVAYIVDFMKRWRILRPQRLTEWTLEGFQGGLFSPEAVAAITAANVQVCPQFYGGDNMVHKWAADRVVLDLVQRGFLTSRIFGYYDAAALPERWEGTAFTQGRLP